MVRTRALVLSGSLFVLSFGHCRSLLVSVWPLYCGSFDGDPVCLSSLLLSHYRWATLRFIVGSTFIGSYVVFTAIS
jgi:hypothetical protein